MAETDLDNDLVDDALEDVGLDTEDGDGSGADLLDDLEGDLPGAGAPDESAPPADPPTDQPPEHDAIENLTGGSTRPASGFPSGADAEVATLRDLPEGANGGAIGAPDLETVMNIPVTISMEIGRSRISIRNLLQLSQGSVVELDRLAGEPLDVLANGTLIAHGEVVVVNEKFGIRLLDIISPEQRIKSIN